MRTPRWSFGPSTIPGRADPSRLISDGNCRGKLSSNRYDPDSVSNACGRYGSEYSPDPINNPYGRALTEGVWHKWGRGTLKQNNVPRPHLFCAGDLQPVHLVVHASRQ